MNKSTVRSPVAWASLCIVIAYLWVSRPLVSHIVVGIAFVLRMIVVTLSSRVGGADMHFIDAFVQSFNFPLEAIDARIRLGGVILDV